VSDEDRKKIESAITDLEGVLSGDNKVDIDAKTQALTEVSSALAQRMYSEEAQGSETSASSGESQTSPEVDSDAVDAEFEEVKDDNK